MKALFRRGVDVNAPENIGSKTPLYYLMRIVCAMSIHHLTVTAKQVKACMLLMCSNGADPNEISAAQENVMTLLLSSLSRWLYHASDDTARTQTLLTFTQDLLNMFLSHGLQPDGFLTKNLKQFVIIFNSTNLDADSVRKLNSLLKCIIKNGGNPNNIKLNNLRGGMAMSFSTKYTVGYYLARGLYIHARYRNQATYEILDLFQKTLSQHSLFLFVSDICHSLQTVFESGSHNQTIQRRIRSMYNVTRSLKQLARIAIFNAIKWRIEFGCSRLPLPYPLIGYLQNID